MLRKLSTWACIVNGVQDKGKTVKKVFEMVEHFVYLEMAP